MTEITNDIRLLEEGLKPGEHYVVRNNHLEKRSSLWSRIKYFFLGSREDALVRARISQLVQEIIKATPKFSKDDEADLRTLFFDRLAKLPDRLFDRRILAVGEQHKQFVALLHPKLKETEKKLEGAAEIERKLERRIEKVRLGIKLGVELAPISAGTSGSYLARDYKVKILGVFKPGSEESLGLNSPKWTARMAYRLIKFFQGIDTAAPFWANNGYVAEVMTSKLAQHLELNTVPPSKITELQSTKFAKVKKEAIAKEGSFQRFVHGAKSADESLGLNSMTIFGGLLLRLNVWRYKEKISQALKKEEFEQLAVLDFLIKNRDRHFENILTKESSDQKLEMHLIDHQLAFPKMNPPQADTYYSRNQYKWSILPQAKQPFSQAMKDNFFAKLTGAALKKLIEEFHQTTKERVKGGPAFNTKFGDTSQEVVFKQSVAVMRKAMELNLTIRQLAEIKSHEQIIAFSQKNGIPVDEEGIDKFLGIYE